MNIMNPKVVEGIKELTRTFILGMIPVLVGVLAIIKAGINVELGTFIIQWNVALAVLVAGVIGVIQTAIMSGIDKWLHENDVKTPLDLRGLDRLADKK